MTAPDFVAVIAGAMRSGSGNGQTVTIPGVAARSALAAKVPELCKTCSGESVIYDLRCDNCGGSASLPLGMTCANHLAKPQPCPDCPTIGQLLAIGAAVWSATLMPIRSPQWAGVVVQALPEGSPRAAIYAEQLLNYLRNVQP